MTTLTPAPVPTLSQPDAAALLACQTEVLELMSAGAALPVMLDVITAGLEQLIPGSRCSVLLAEGGVLRHGSAPSLPASYLTAIDGLVPGPDAGSCGTAAYTGLPVVVPDVRADRRWRHYRDVAAAAGLRACWSTPIVGAAHTVVGTFAVYHVVCHEPNDRERGVVERLTYLASVAIAHHGMLDALTVSEERFRRAFEDNAVPMALLTTDGRLTRVNAALRHLLGADTSGRRDGCHLVDLAAPGERARLATTLREMHAGRTSSAHLQLALGMGETTVSLAMSVVRGARDEPDQISISMLDITQRLVAARERQARHEAETARRAAEAASRAKSELLSAVSHEMRTPLQAITGFAELLGSLDLTPDRRHEALRHIRTGAAHLLELVDDTLDLARIEAGALALAPEAVPAGDLVAEVLQFLAPVAREHRVRLARGVLVGVLHGDRRRLRQVLINLVSNGLRYGGTDATVTVSTTTAGRQVRLVVADDGPGIPASVRARLFEAFIQDDPGGEGAGLGLMLARGLTEAMGGQLSLADAVPHGTVATVLLPAASSVGSAVERGEEP